VEIDASELQVKIISHFETEIHHYESLFREIVIYHGENHPLRGGCETTALANWKFSELPSFEEFVNSPCSWRSTRHWLNKWTTYHAKHPHQLWHGLRANVHVIFLEKAVTTSKIYHVALWAYLLAGRVTLFEQVKNLFSQRAARTCFPIIIMENWAWVATYDELCTTCFLSSTCFVVASPMHYWTKFSWLDRPVESLRDPPQFSLGLFPTMVPIYRVASENSWGLAMYLFVAKDTEKSKTMRSNPPAHIIKMLLLPRDWNDTEN
jgi:hypothetical protein